MIGCWSLSVAHLATNIPSLLFQVVSPSFITHELQYDIAIAKLLMARMNY